VGATSIHINYVYYGNLFTVLCAVAGTYVVVTERVTLAMALRIAYNHIWRGSLRRSGPASST